MGFYDQLGNEGFLPPDDELVAGNAPAFGEDADPTPAPAPAAPISPETASAPTAPAVDAAAALAPGMTPAEEANQTIDRSDLAIAAAVVTSIEEWIAARKRAGQMEEPTDAEIMERAAALVHERRAELTLPEQTVTRAAFRRMRGLLGLEQFLDNPKVSDIMINSSSEVFIEEAGQKKQVTSPFLRPEDLDLFIEKIKDGSTNLNSPSNGEPIVDGRFEYPLPRNRKPGDPFVNVRVNIVHRSRTADNETTITLRKPVDAGYDNMDTWTRVPDDLDEGPLTPAAARFLQLCFEKRANILLVGGTGSGKTSLLKALLTSVPVDERLLAVEDSNELVLTNPNSKGLVASKEVPIARLIEAAMRMFPDRIIVGECRKPAEVAAFLEAVNTGHDGSITTTHASSAADGLNRLLTLAASSGDKSSQEMVGQLIFNGLHVVVYLGAKPVDRPDGSEGRLRRVMEIISISDFRVENGVPKFFAQPIFGRFMLDAYGSEYQYEKVDIMRPLVCRGVAGLSQKLRAHLATQGVTDEQLASLLPVDQPGDSPSL